MMKLNTNPYSRTYCLYTTVNIFLLFFIIFSDYIYKGEENHIIASIQLSTYINCNFYLEWYPFDSQNCFISLEIANAPKDSTEILTTRRKLVMDFTKQTFGGQTEYIVSNYYRRSSQNSFNVSFELQREVSYHIFSTYLPIFLLHGIGYGTMFIRFDNFQDRGTMSLTTLLVLIALYTDTMSSLPVTSYVKLIDVWFIFSVIFLSSIIAVHLITNDTTTKVIQLKKSYKVCFYRNIQHIFKLARIILGACYIIFFAMYVGIAASRSNRQFL